MPVLFLSHVPVSVFLFEDLPCFVSGLFLSKLSWVFLLSLLYPRLGFALLLENVACRVGDLLFVFSTCVIV